MEVGSRTNSRSLLSDWKGRRGTEQIIKGEDYHFFSKKSDVLDWVANFRVVVQSWSRELPQELAPIISLEREKSKTSAIEVVDQQLSCNLASLIRL